MNASEWDMQNFITPAKATELVEALKGERRELQLDTGIRLELALQALQDGYSLTDIIEQVTERLEHFLIAQILVSTDGNKAETARILKIDYKTLYRKMYKYFGTFSDFVPPAAVEGAGFRPGRDAERGS